MSGRLTIAAVRDGAAVRAALRSHGFASQVIERKCERFALAAKALTEGGHGDDTPVLAFHVPGRIEVLGKHTDYAGGRTVVTAADRGLAMLVVPRDDATVRLTSDGMGPAREFALDPDLAPTEGDWANYPMTVARRIARNFDDAPLRGADIALASDLPPASGMSSSSALIVAAFLALFRANTLPARDRYRRNLPDILSLAEYLGTVENGQSFRDLSGDRGVGTFGGSEDHVAILCGRPGRLSEYSYCPVRFLRDIALPAGLVFVVASSGVLAEKTGAARERYNRASRLAGEAARAWRERTGRSEPHLGAIAADPANLPRLRALLAGGTDEATGAELLDRVEHFVQESTQIIPAAGDALAGGDLAEFAAAVAQSQAAAESLLGNQVPETIHLARGARGRGGGAASAWGGGFGGSVWALVGEERWEAMRDAWRADYARAFPAPARRSEFFATRAGAAAMEVGQA